MQKPDRQTRRSFLTAALVILLAAFLRQVPLEIVFFSGILRSFLYLGLFCAWGVSIHVRIMQCAIRRWLTAAAALIILLYGLRTCKYNFVSASSAENRLLWYLYYAPMLMAPPVSLCAALCLGKEDSFRLPRRTMLVFLPSCVIFLLILSNDRHQYAFHFPDGIGAFNTRYLHGPVYWAAVIWGAGVLLLSLIMLLLRARVYGTRRWFWPPFAALGLGILYSVLYIFHVQFLYRFFGDMPVVFCLLYLMIWESCIQCGMIPSNTHYGELLAASTIAAQITDSDYRVCYSSGKAPVLPEPLMRQAEREPVRLNDRLRVRSVPIRGGHVLWTDDVSAVNRLNRARRAVGVQLAENNELLKAEVSLKRRQAKIDEQNRLYDLITQDTEAQLETLDGILRTTSPDDPDIRSRLADICVISAYLKRRSNLVILGESGGRIPVQELSHCLRESADYLRLRGAVSSFASDADGLIGLQTAEALYDLFEQIAESVLPGLSAILINLTENGGDLLLKIAISGRGELPDSGRRSMLSVPLGGSCAVSRSGNDRIFLIRMPKGGDAV